MVDPVSTALGAGPLGAICLLLLRELRYANEQLAEVAKESAEAQREAAVTLAKVQTVLEGRQSR